MPLEVVLSADELRQLLLFKWQLELRSYADLVPAASHRLLFYRWLVLRRRLGGPNDGGA